MIDQRIKKKSDCMGCTACEAICPTKCIVMEVDKFGFSSPKVNYAECINCRICLKTCPIDNKKGNLTIKTFALINKNVEERTNSSSGGFFKVLAKYTIEEKGGYVCGAAFTDSIDLKHKIIADVSDIDSLMGSKYLNSELGDIFYAVKKLLIKGEFVLFTGLPCQVAGLIRYLSKEYDNLITMDIVCHGVPSKTVFKSYLRELESDKGRVTKFSFRDKSNGWYNYRIKIEYENGSIVSHPHYKDPYMKLFLDDYILMEACYKCEFKRAKKESDFYVGDYWKGEMAHSKLFDDRGMSVVLVNTPKASRIFESIGHNFEYEETEMNHVVKYNPALVKRANKPLFTSIILWLITKTSIHTSAKLLFLKDKVMFIMIHPVKSIKIYIKRSR